METAATTLADVHAPCRRQPFATAREASVPNEIRNQSDAVPTRLEPGPRPRAQRKIEDQTAQTGADQHGPVWTLPKQPITFGTQQVHSGQKARGG
jgi:hypothetical protein